MENLAEFLSLKLFADDEIMEEVMGYKLAKVEEDPDRYFDQLVGFYKEMGYDYVPFYQAPPFQLPITSMVKTRPHGRERKWMNEKGGPIKTLKDLQEADWPKPEEAVDFDLSVSWETTFRRNESNWRCFRWAI